MFYDILRQFREEHRWKVRPGHRDKVYFRADATPTRDYLTLEVGTDGGVTFTTAGTDPDFEIATASAASIILDAAGDVTLESGGAAGAAKDIVLDSASRVMIYSLGRLVQIGTLTEQVDVDIHLGANYMLDILFDVDNYARHSIGSDGDYTISTVGDDPDFEVATSASGAITLDSASAIHLECDGNEHIYVNAMIETSVAAGSPILKSAATDDAVRHVVAESGAGGFVFDASAAGWLEILVGADARYIPFWNLT